MAQEPSLLTDFSTRATQEYSDLFAVSGTSFLSPAIDQTATTIEPNSPPSPKPPLSNHLPDNSSLIDLLSKTPLPPKRTHPPASQDHDDEISKLQNHSPTRSSKKYSFLMDHSISSFDLLPKALSPSTPSSRKNTHPTSKPAVSPHPHWTPPTSPTKAHHILSSHLNFDPPTPSAQSKTKSSQSGSTNITRTHSVDLIALEHNHTPRPSISRSKSTTAIQHEQTHQAEPSCLSDDSEPPKATKSILKRPNSPSKGARARFFSPRVVSGLSGDEESDGNESSWVDEHGNCRGREIIHEFQKDEPPMTRPNPIFKPPCISQSTTPRKTVLPSSVPASSSSSNGRRHHHTPKFIIPEPIDLGIDPILPRHSTSPSPSPPPIPAASYLMNAKAHRKSASVNVIQPPRNQITRAASESLIFNAPDNFSNILDESGGFLCGNETTWTGENKERSTELSIDLNHVAMMELLGKKKAGDNRTVSRPGPKFNTRGSECEVVPEEEESVDVSGLARQLQDIKSCPLDNFALKDEQAPANLQASMDFSTTFELSKINLPPLPTDRDQLWKNSKPMEPSVTRPKRHSMSNVYQHVGKREVTDGDTTRLKNKIDSIKLSAREDTRSVTKDDLFSELMSAPPPFLTTQREKVSQPNKANPPTSKITTALPSARPSTAHKRLSGQLVAFPGKPIESKITHTNPVSKPRRSCISTSVVPVRPKRTSNIGIGLPPSTSAPVIHTLTKLSAKTNSNTTGLTGVRSKLKPSNALVKPSQTSGSPKTMKNRSSLSNINLNSPRLLYRASPSKNIATPVPTTATSMTTMMASPTNTRKTIPVPGSTTGRTLPAPRSYTASSASSARSALLDGPPRSALPPPGSLSNRPRTAPLSSAIPASSQPSRILPPSSPSKTLARQIKQKI